MVGTFCAARPRGVLPVLSGRPGSDVLIIGRLGRARAGSTLLHFFLYTLLGSVLMLAPRIMALYWERRHHRHPDADARRRAHVACRPGRGWRVFASFAVKMPSGRCNTWLPDAHVRVARPRAR